MKISKFSLGTASSDLIKKGGYEYSIFMNQVYDSAIMGVDLVTCSVIYSLSKLVYIDMEEMENEGLPDDLMDRQVLFHFIVECFFDLISDIRDSEDGIPPTILQDLTSDYKMTA